jgi:SAM-dependent methyltransferase
MNLQHLKAIREFELDQVLALLPPSGRVLEVGSGAGWQSQQMAARGYWVVAVDLPESNYASVADYPPVLYDGSHLPFADNSFDIVFSSNVLEHVEDLAALFADIRRVLDPSGLAIHVLPTPSWRFWTMGTHYLALPRSRGIRGKLRSLWQPRHGVRGNLLTEHYFFSRLYWEAQFKHQGWAVLKYRPNSLFYTGYSILDSRLTIRRRMAVANFLGSACGIFVLKDRTQRVSERKAHSRSIG